MRTHIETVYMRANALQFFLKPFVDCIDIRHGELSQSDATLIRDYEHPHARTVQLQNCFRSSREQMKAIPRANVTAFRRFDVDRSIPVKKCRMSLPCSRSDF